MMKKLLLAIPLVAGASWAGATYYTGSQTQSAYDKLLVQLNELKPFTLVNENYSAGLTNSTAITRVMDSTGSDAKLLFRLHHAINHSPIGMGNDGMRVGAATIKTTLVRDDSLPQSLVDFMASFKDSEPVQINTDVSFDGSTVNRLLVSAYEHDYPDVSVRFDGIDYVASVEGDLITGSGTIGELRVSGDDGEEFKLTAGDISTDLKRVSQAVYEGSYGIAFEKLSVSSPQMPFDVALQSIGLTSDTTVTNGKLDSRGTFSIANIDSPLPLNSVSVAAGVKAIDVSGMEEAVAGLSELSFVDQMVGTDPEVVAAVLNAYSSMIGAGSGLDYGVKISNDNGDADASFAVSIVDAASAAFPAGGLSSLQTVRDLLNVVKVDIKAVADAPLVDQSPLAMFMMAPEAQQFIVTDGVTYSSDIAMSDLVVYVNGNPMALEFMMGEMLDMPLETLMQM